MNTLQLTLNITIFANAIASQLNDDDLELLAVILNQFGDTLTTISTQRSLCKSNE